jgi:hypothetical protein
MMTQLPGMNYPLAPAAGAMCAWQPNELDIRRIKRLLQQRTRYLYVMPQVKIVEHGYCIQSPCCSRNLDSSGGLVDIARLEYDIRLGVWKLFRKDHQENRWDFFSLEQRLEGLMDYLNVDAARLFWQ